MPSLVVIVVRSSAAFSAIFVLKTVTSCHDEEAGAFMKIFPIVFSIAEAGNISSSPMACAQEATAATFVSPALVNATVPLVTDIRPCVAHACFTDESTYRLKAIESATDFSRSPA